MEYKVVTEGVNVLKEIRGRKLTVWQGWSKGRIR
jgi:hypothetical protein